jgi:hypothetical protein
MSQDPDLAWLAPKLALAVADQIKGSGKDRETKERHALAMARILQPEKLPKGGVWEVDGRIRGGSLVALAAIASVWLFHWAWCGNILSGLWPGASSACNHHLIWRWLA